MKALLKPAFSKVFLALLLFILVSALWRAAIRFIVSDTFPYGVPFPFMLAWGPCPPGETCAEFHPFNLVLDLAIWYFIGAWIVSRFQKKS